MVVVVSRELFVPFSSLKGDNKMSQGFCCPALTLSQIPWALNFLLLKFFFFNFVRISVIYLKEFFYFFLWTITLSPKIHLREICNCKVSILPSHTLFFRKDNRKIFSIGYKLSFLRSVWICPGNLRIQICFLSKKIG